MASSTAPERRELHVMLAPSEETKRPSPSPAPALASVVWYNPGTTSVDLRETIANRLALQCNEFVLQARSDKAHTSIYRCHVWSHEPDSGNVVALSAGLPSGLTLHVRYFASTEGKPSATNSASSQSRAVPKVAAATTASSPGHLNDLSKPLLDSTDESAPRLSVRVPDTKRTSAIQALRPTAATVCHIARCACSARMRGRCSNRRRRESPRVGQEMQELLRPLETMLPNSACYPYARSRDESQVTTHAIDGAAAHSQRASQGQTEQQGWRGVVQG
eukprot:6181126-Pleurochrysis_carterae.AAC.1